MKKQFIFVGLMLILMLGFIGASGQWSSNTGRGASNVVGQGNGWLAFVQDFSLATLVLPNGAGYTPPSTEAACGFDTTAHRLVCYNGTTVDEYVVSGDLINEPGTCTDAMQYDAGTNVWTCGTSINGTAIPASKTLMATDTNIADGQMATKYKTRICEVITYGSGAAGVLADGDDVQNACTNATGATETLIAYGCWVDSTTGSPTATPVLGDGSTAIVTGAVSCTATVNTLAMGTLDGTPTLTAITNATGACASGSCTVNANITTAGGTAKVMKHVFVFTY